MSLIKGKALRGGETIGLITPGSPIQPELFQKGVSELEKRGFRVKSPFDPSAQYQKSDFGFASASPLARAEAFHALVRDSDVAAIIGVRGGYGSIDLLPILDFKLIRSLPKPIIGYSDMTVLLAAVTQHSQLVTIHGPTIGAEFARASESAEAKESVESLFQLLMTPTFTAQYPCEVLRPGQGKGPILVGNLTMFLSLLGTPWDLPYDGKILILEDVHEPPYRIHRALNQLRLASKLSNLAGLIFGRFSQSQEEGALSVDETLRYSLKDIFSGTSYPVLAGFQCGHDGKNIAVPQGAQGEIKEGSFWITESAVC